MDAAQGGSGARNEELLGWGSKQGAILTGNGKLNKVMLPGRDYGEEDLPHYHKSRNSCWSTCDRWLTAGHRTDLVAGAWSRPLFCGGWGESGAWDTAVFNIQTPSIFVDLRFPHARPELSSRGGFATLSMDELRALSRQHCFAGFTLVRGSPPVAHRHHAIDWNYHPSFPRARPNAWRIEAHPDRSSFKEWSVALDEHGQAVYMERWQRLPCSDGPFLALRRLAPSKSDAILCVAGEHFGFALDRPHPLPEYPEAKGGGCGNLADAAWKAGDRGRLEHLLQLQGSYGLVRGGSRGWRILKSTWPWLEGSSLLDGKDAAVEVHCRENDVPVQVLWRGETWEVLECSFDRVNLISVLTGTPAPHASL